MNDIKKPKKEVIIKQKPLEVKIGNKKMHIHEIKKNGDMIVSPF